MTLEGKTALVTGGGRGIGRAIAEKLSQEGARVIVSGRTRSELDQVASSIGGIAISMDVADRKSIESALNRMLEQSLQIDVLVNNAGASESAPFEKTTDEIWDSMLAVNATSAFILCRALIPGMIQRGFGRVINVASNAGLTGYAYTSAYCASKHAMVGMTRAIALEIARTAVTINCVCPGWVNTKMAGDAAARIAKKTGRSEEDAARALAAMSPQRRMIEPEEVAHAVAMLCSPAAKGIHGQAIAIDGGQTLS